MIRTRLTILNCAVLALVLALVGIAIYFFTRQRLYAQVDADLLDRAQSFAQGWTSGPKSPALAMPPLPSALSPDTARERGIDPHQLDRFHALAEALLPMVIDLNGKDIYSRTRQMWDRKSFDFAKSGATSFGAAREAGVPLRVVSVPLYIHGQLFGVAQLASPVDGVEEELSQLARTLGIVLPLAILVMLATGVFLTRRALAPVSRIADAADRIGATSLEDRLPVQGKDEFATLAATFNRMLGRLARAFKDKDEAYERQRRFTADASHELKTPLAAIRARVGLALKKDTTPEELREHVQAIDRASLVMSGVVKDLLLLAKSDEGTLLLQRSPVSVESLFRDAADSVDINKRDLHVAAPERLKIDVDQAAFTRVLVNLLENAVQHTRTGSRICLSAELEGKDVKIEVSDNGEGIPAQHVPLVFNRFHRVDSSRERTSGGSGLGLAIAKGIVEAHGGTISLASELGKGTTVSILVPQ